VIQEKKKKKKKIKKKSKKNKTPKKKKKKKKCLPGGPTAWSASFREADDDGDVDTITPQKIINIRPSWRR